MAPYMLPWSVSPMAGIPSFFARATISFTFAFIEYDGAINDIRISPERRIKTY